MSAVRRALILAALAAIVLTRIDLKYLQFPFIDRTPVARAFAHYADRGGWLGYVRFLEGVRARTQPGDSIAIVIPTLQWDGGYAYAYYRAHYFLAGREVLPLVTGDGRFHPENFDRARYVAAWRTRVPPQNLTTVWSGEDGILSRR